MQLDLLSFDELSHPTQSTINRIKHALSQKGIVGIQNVSGFEPLSKIFIDTARNFSSFPEAQKQRYAPNRDIGETEGYELGAEWFQNASGEWQIDDKKASFYAFVPDHAHNRWPAEINLKDPYIELGELMFQTGKSILHAIGLNEHIGMHHDRMIARGRMLHYHKENESTNFNPDWCGAHFDHGVFTALMPAYYFQNGLEIEEPEEAGLFIIPTNERDFKKVVAPKNTILFQAGEFGQLMSNDEIKATRHIVRKAKQGIERFTFALFFNPEDNMRIQPDSLMTNDPRYQKNQSPDGSVRYIDWELASYDQYRAIEKPMSFG